MLEFCKKILRKVSFDRKLFKKELSKAYNWLKKEERQKLKNWSLKTYGRYYQREIRETFDDPAL